MAMSWPAAASRRAVAAPMPRLPPVTMVTEVNALSPALVVRVTLP